MSFTSRETVGESSAEAPRHSNVSLDASSSSLARADRLSSFSPRPLELLLIHLSLSPSPTLCINAFDDPIIGGPLLPISTFLKSSYAVLAIVGIGGHLGHFMGGFPFFSPPKRWLHTPIGEFLTAAEKELVDTETLPGGVKREVRRVEGKVGYEVVKEEEQEAGPFTWVKRKRVAVKME